MKVYKYTIIFTLCNFSLFIYGSNCSRDNIGYEQVLLPYRIKFTKEQFSSMWNVIPHRTGFHITLKGITTVYSLTKCALLCTNTILFTLAGAKEDRFACSVSPAIEKTISHGALVVGTARMPRANIDSRGNVSVYPFYHCSKSSESSEMHRYC